MRWTDLAWAAGLYGFVVVGFRSWYSAPLLDPAAFRGYYGQGVYAHRVLGREVALALQRALGDPLGEHLVLGGQRPLAEGMATAVLLLDGISLLAVVALSGRLLARRSVPEPARTLVQVVLVVVLVASLSTLTPYDLPAAALVLGALSAADARPPWDLAAIPLVALGVATRESALVAVAALLAVLVVERAALDRRRVAVAIAAALVAAATYGALVASGDDPSLWSAVTLRGNVGRLAGWVGLVAMVGAWLAWRGACRAAELDDPEHRRLVAWCWLLASPYVVAALLVGYWFEVRLLVPMLVVEAWARTRPVAQPQVGASRQSSRPAGDVASGSPATSSEPAGAS